MTLKNSQPLGKTPKYLFRETQQLKSMFRYDNFKHRLITDHCCIVYIDPIHRDVASPTPSIRAKIIPPRIAEAVITFGPERTARSPPVANPEKIELKGSSLRKERSNPEESSQCEKT